jgi:hypothetical protein
LLLSSIAALFRKDIWLEDTYRYLILRSVGTFGDLIALTAWPGKNSLRLNTVSDYNA